MVLVLLSGTIAGCTSDPDGGGNDGIDSDALDDLFDEYLQDFVNNTSITVNNHYHNNTTVVNNDYDTNNEYSNTTNVDGGEITNYNQFNGSGGSNSIMQMFTVNWHIEELIGYDPAESIVYGGNSTLLYVNFYNGQTVEFRDISCEEWLNYRSYSNDNWERYLRNNYGDDWDNVYNVAYDIEDHFQANDHEGYDAYEQCNTSLTHLGDNSYDPASRVILYEIHLEQGQAMSYLLTTSYVTVDVNCDDGYGTGLGNGTGTAYIGGQANCTVTGSTVPEWALSSQDYQRDENGDILHPDGRILYEYGAVSYTHLTLPTSDLV